MAGLMMAAGSRVPVAEAGGVEFIAAGTVNGTGNDDLTLQYPAGSGAGDRLIAWMAWSNSGADVSSSGWTVETLVETTGICGFLAHRIHPGSGTSATFTDSNFNGFRSIGAIVAYSGVDSVDDPTEAFESDAGTTDHDSGTVTPVAANSLILACFAVKSASDTSWTEPAGMDERVDGWHTTPDVAIGIFEVLQASTDPVSKTAVSSTAGRGVSYILALTPAS